MNRDFLIEFPGEILEPVPCFYRVSSALYIHLRPCLLLKSAKKLIYLWKPNWISFLKRENPTMLTNHFSARTDFVHPHRTCIQRTRRFSVECLKYFYFRIGPSSREDQGSSEMRAVINSESTTLQEV